MMITVVLLTWDPQHVDVYGNCYFFVHENPMRFLQETKHTSMKIPCVSFKKQNTHKKIQEYKKQSVCYPNNAMDKVG